MIVLNFNVQTINSVLMIAIIIILINPQRFYNNKKCKIGYMTAWFDVLKATFTIDFFFTFGQCYEHPHSHSKNVNNLISVPINETPILIKKLKFCHAYEDKASMISLTLILCERQKLTISLAITALARHSFLLYCNCFFFLTRLYCGASPMPCLYAGVVPLATTRWHSNGWKFGSYHPFY